MELIGQIFRLLFGIAMVMGLLAFIYKRTAVDWDALCKAYARTWEPPLQLKKLQSMILYRDGRLARSYKGLLTIGLYRNGIGIRPFIWLLPFHYPIFVPYSDIQGWKQKWYVDAKSVELGLRRSPSIRIIMPAEQVDWILSSGVGEFPVSPDYPPHGRWPWWTFVFAVTFGIMSVVAIGISIYSYINL